jgi:hypothetical protein
MKTIRRRTDRNCAACAPLPRLAALACAAAITFAPAAVPAATQWTVVNLNPPGATMSHAWDVTGTQQVGMATVGGRAQASIWTGSPLSWVNLTPAGAPAGEILGASATEQVGWALVGGASRASLWRGTAESWTSLHPAGAASSDAIGIFGDQQVGWARIGGRERAGLWHGTPASWVDLHPGGVFLGSRAVATTGAVQVGRVVLLENDELVFRPSLWRGSAASWVDLSPAGATQGIATGAYRTRQVGWVTVDGLDRASLWTGTADSWVSLNPPGVLVGHAYGIHGNQQVGYVFIGGRARASLWSGTADSWQALPMPAGNWSDTIAWSIWREGTTTYIVGYGWNLTTRTNEALLWVGQEPPPANVSGNLGLAGWTGPLTDPLVTFEVRAPGTTTALQTSVVALSATGEFSFTTALPPGTYDVTAKSDRWLRARLQNVTFTAAGTSGLAFGELIPGDVVENNAVDLADFLALAGTYEVSPPTEARADLNGDGEVDLADFLLLAAHYETVGAP